MFFSRKVPKHKKKFEECLQREARYRFHQTKIFHEFLENSFYGERRGNLKSRSRVNSKLSEKPRPSIKSVRKVSKIFVWWKR